MTTRTTRTTTTTTTGTTGATGTTGTTGTATRTVTAAAVARAVGNVDLDDLERRCARRPALRDDLIDTVAELARAADRPWRPVADEPVVTAVRALGRLALAVPGASSEAAARLLDGLR